MFDRSILTHDVFTCVVKNWVAAGERMKMSVGLNQSKHALRVRMVAKPSKLLP